MKSFDLARGSGGGTRGKAGALYPQRVLGIIALALLIISAAACTDFERSCWVTLRDADSAIGSLTADYSRWKAEQPPRFTAAQIETLRSALNRANEGLATGEAAFSSWRQVRGLVAEQKATAADLEVARQKLVSALEELKRAVNAARVFWKTLSSSAPAQPPVELAQGGLTFIAILLSLLGEFASAILSGRTGAITQAAINLVAAVLQTHQVATGEDIDLALPELRARIAERRKILAPPAGG